jgi:hypothetical protein
MLFRHVFLFPFFLIFLSFDITYTLMHALFHIKTVIIPRVDIGRGMITVLIWKKACINLFITYFNIELKRTKLTSQTDTKLMDMSDQYRLRLLLPKRQQIFPRWTSTFSKRKLTVGRKWRHGAHERLDIVLSEFCPDGRYRCARMGKIDVITYEYVIMKVIPGPLHAH